MLKWLNDYNKPLLWMFWHLFLGFISTISAVPLIAYFYLFLILSLTKISSKIPKDFQLNLIIVYLIPFEILARMTKTSPYIPYELGKYLMFFLLVIGIIRDNRKVQIGYFLLVLLLPALFYDFSNEVDYQDLVFNIMAPINLCLGIIYFYRKAIRKSEFHKLLISMVLPLISALVYTYFKTPDFDTIDFSLGANFDTTGGFGSNQVSTVFGLGMFLTFYLWFNGLSISGIRSFDAVIFFLFSFQGLLSFSRGGMIGAILAIFIYLFFSRNRDKLGFGFSSNRPSVKLILPIIVLIIGSSWLANTVSNGQLLMRYKGETEGTISGFKEKDINTITSNRASIFEGDFELFIDNNFGVGVGASRYLRNTENGVVSHTELSRLLAEHGYFGLIFFLILTLIPIVFLKKGYSREFKGVMFALFFLAWYTSFHAATRNFVTPLLIGFSLMTFVREERVKKLDIN
jgi:hypothetical protein